MPATPNSRHPDRMMAARVLARDGIRCVRCGSEDNLHVDHIDPWSKGGKTVLENLQTLCRPCNSRKGAIGEAELALIGKSGLLTIEGNTGHYMDAEIQVLQVRASFGRLDLLVTPTQGSGEAWVSADRVKVKGGK